MPAKKSILCLTILLAFSCHIQVAEIISSSPQVKDGVESLFDGKTLKNWRVTNFGGQGSVSVENGQIILDIGSDLTGITWAGELPQLNYEISLGAMRLAGNDFFCGMTFPVGEAYCSLIVGGWGGSVVGLSSIDGLDASENETGIMKRFQSQQWYSIRLRVSKVKIEAWIDQEKVVDFDIQGRKLSTRSEVTPSQPFGISSWRTRAALRNVTRRILLPAQ